MQVEAGAEGARTGGDPMEKNAVLSLNKETLCNLVSDRRRTTTVTTAGCDTSGCPSRNPIGSDCICEP